MYVLSIIPMVKINIGGDTPQTRRYAVASFAEKDIFKTDRVLNPFYRPLLRKAPRGFSISVESSSMTFADLATALAERRYRISSPAPVEMRINLKFDENKGSQSKPFPGRMVIAADEETPGGEGDRNFFFDCHSHWHSTLGLNRYTYCHDTGPCPTPKERFCDTEECLRSLLLVHV